MKMKHIMVTRPGCYWSSQILEDCSDVIQWSQATYGKAGEFPGKNFNLEVQINGGWKRRLKSWSERESGVGPGGDKDILFDILLAFLIMYILFPHRLQNTFHNT